MNSGAVFLMPLTPRHAALAYDGNVYTVPLGSAQRVQLHDESDVLALNELQYLRAAENLYFADWNDRHRIEREFESTREGARKRGAKW